MAEKHSYTSFTNGKTLLTNLCNYGNRNGVSDLEVYGPYIDKIRTFFVPSLEHRICSLLQHFVYSTDSRGTKPFPCFKKFIKGWKDTLDEVAECDISTTEEIIKSRVKYMIKNEVVSCFLDTIVLRNRLNKVCRDLDALGIENGILRNCNIWNFTNEKNFWVNHDRFTNSDSTADCDRNSNVIRFNDVGESSRCEKAVKPSVKKDIYQNENADRTQPETSKNRTPELRQVLHSDQYPLKEKASNPWHSRDAKGRRSTDKIVNKIEQFFTAQACNTELSNRMKNSPLKMIVSKLYMEDCGCSISSRRIVAFVSLPCKSRNLIGRIFEADPLLLESCLIVMKRKFEISMCNVSSCLNDIFRKLHVKFTRTIYLSCEIRAGYISFKLKSNETTGCFFVARVPICQNVRQHLYIQQETPISYFNSNISVEVENSDVIDAIQSSTCNNDDSNFSNALGYVDKANEKLSDTHCSCLEQEHAEDITLNTSENITFPCAINENIWKCDRERKIAFCNECPKKISGKMSNTELYVDNCERKNDEYCKTPNLIKDRTDGCNNLVEKNRMENFNVCNLVTENDEQLVNNTKCIYSFTARDIDKLPRNATVDEYDCTCSNKELHSECGICSVRTSSITSFVQSSAHDKQLVELNYNNFSDSNIIAGKESDIDDNSLSNDANVKVANNLNYSCRYNDFIDITVIDNNPKVNVSHAFHTLEDDLNTTKIEKRKHPGMTKLLSKDDKSLSGFLHIPRLKVASKGISVDISCPRSTLWLVSDNDENVSTIVSPGDKCNGSIDTFVRTSINGNKVLRNKNEKDFDGNNRIDNFTKSPEKSAVFEGRPRSDIDSKSSRISTKKYLRSCNRSTYTSSNTLHSDHSLSTNDRRNLFSKSHKSRYTLKLHGGRCASSSYGIRSITSATTIKYSTTLHRRWDNYSADVQPQTTFMMAKFRSSVEKSVNRIKHLIRTKFGRIFLGDRGKMMNASRTFRKNKRPYEDSGRKRIYKRYSRQDCGVATSSVSDYCRRSYTISRESSGVILSICKKREKERSKEGMKFDDDRLAGSGEAFPSFRFIKTSPCFYDLSTPAARDLKLCGINKRRYPEKKETKNRPSVKYPNYSKNSSRYDLRNQGISAIISPRSDQTLKQKRACNDRHICKRMHNRGQHEDKISSHVCRLCSNGRTKYQVSTRYVNGSNEEFSKMSTSSCNRREENKDTRERLYEVSTRRSMKKFSALRKNPRIFEENAMSKSGDDRLHKRRAFAISTETCDDCVDDLGLDFKSKLTRYVELCKSVKRSLMKTLQPDDIYEVSTASMPCSTTRERV